MDCLPRISIITPSYNQAEYIEETILSVLSQKYSNLDYIVMDGGSTDGTIEILNKYSSQLRWFSEKDRGQSHAINKGIKLATGDFLAYLNADDIYEKNALINIGNYLCKFPQARWITGKCRFINQDGYEIRRFVTLYKNFWLLSGSYNGLLILDYVSQPATFWHRDVFNKVGKFNENFHYAMDYDFSLRVGKVFKLWRINHYLASYRIHGKSKTFSSPSAIKTQFDEDLAIAKENGAPNFLFNLHLIHNEMIKFIYRMLIRGSTEYEPES